ncbi:MAG: transposase, partial [Chlamydiota bacterium]|nr:transposase [Chlamydiota bacterium]
KARSYRCKLYQGRQFLGYCKSKKLNFFGLKVHIVVNEHGVLCGFYITPGSKSDVKSLGNYELPLPQGSIIMADKAYTSYELEDLLLEDLLFENDQIILLPLRKKIFLVNMPLTANK